LKPEFEHLLKPGGGRSGEDGKKRKAPAVATASDAADATADQSAAKKRRESSGGDDGEAIAVSNGTPSKVKRAFAFFVKAMRPEAEATMGPGASVRFETATMYIMCLMGMVFF
jgi:hypothetical protein